MLRKGWRLNPLLVIQVEKKREALYNQQMDNVRTQLMLEKNRLELLIMTKQANESRL